MDSTNFGFGQNPLDFYQPQLFPTTIYHPVLGTRVVEDQAELDLYSGQGWTREAEGDDTQASLDARIQDLSAKLDELVQKREQLYGALPESEDEALPKSRKRKQSA